MGWWQIDKHGVRADGATGAIWGDEIADLMDHAVDQIREIYAREFGREPAEAEFEYGLRFSLHGQR